MVAISFIQNPVYIWCRQANTYQVYIFIENMEHALREERAMLNKYLLLIGAGNTNVATHVKVIQLFPDRPFTSPPIPRLSEK